MPANVDDLLGLLLDVSTKAALLAVVAGALMFATRVRNANLRHRVWSAVLVAMLALPLLVFVAPNVPVPIVKHATVPEVPSQATRPVPVQEAPMQRLAEPVIATNKFVAADPTPTPALGDDVAGSALEPASQLTISHRVHLPSVVLFMYLAGVAWFGLRLFIGIWRAWQLVRLAHVIELPPNQRGIVGMTGVRESSLVHVPLTVGWWRPTIVLPNDWRSWDEPMLVAVLSHEQEHVRRGDPWIALLAELNRTIYWFHPVAWFLRRRLSTLAEAACDDAVVASLGDRTGYARHLLTVAGRLTGRSRRLAPAGVAMARTSQVEQRINAVLDSNRPLARRLSIATTLAIVVVAAPLVMLTAGLEAGDEKLTTTTPTATAAPAPAAASPAFEAGWSSRDAASQNEIDAANFSAGPIRELKSKNGGRAFEFPINVPKGRKFGISFGEWPAGRAAPTYSRREKESDGPATATLQMEYTSNSKAKQRDDVLLSDDEWMEFRLNVTGSYPGGVTHIAGVPLRKVRQAEKKVILIPPDSPLAKAKSGIRLLLIVRKDQDPKTADDVEKIEPRGELIVSLEPVEKPKPGPTPLQRLAQTWRQSEAGIGTFYVRYQNIRGDETWFKPLDVEAVHKIVRDAAAHNLKPNYGTSDTDSEQSHQFAAEILRAAMSDEGLKLLGGEQIKMPQSVFRMVGMKTFSIFGTRAGEKPSRYHLFDGDVDLEYDTFNKQLNVMRAGQSHMGHAGLIDFRTVLRTPNIGFVDIDKTLAKAAVKDLPYGRMLISFGGLEVVANPQNGFVERFTVPLGNTAANEILQFGPKEFPGKLTFPRSRFAFDYRDGKLRTIAVFTNDELRLNEGFSDSDFALKLPAGVVVVDYRHSEFRPDVTKIEEEIPDAAAYAKTHDSPAAETKRYAVPKVKLPNKPDLAPARPAEK